MFRQSPSKVKGNRLRQILQNKGHGIRSAAREIGMSPADFCERIAAYDDGEALAAKIAALPERNAPKMKTLRRATKRGPNAKTKATAPAGR